jgi:lipopolysaccharide export LptBFGC system permease protein LptF
MNKEIVLLLLKKYVKPFISVNLICLLGALFYHLISTGKQLSDYGLPLKVAYFSFYKYGWIFTITLPLATLISTMILFARIQIESLPISEKKTEFFLFISPLLIFSLFLSMLLYLHNDWILPEFNHRLAVNYYAINRFHTSKDSTRQIIINYDDYPRGMREMNRSMLMAEINRNRRGIGDCLSEDLSLKLKGQVDGYYQRKIEFYEEEISRLRSEIYKRYSLSMSVFCFVWLGVSLGFISRKRNLFNICGVGLGIFYLYWLSLGIVDKLCQRNFTPPITMWVPNGLLILAGLIFFYFARKKFILYLKERENSLPANQALKLLCKKSIGF